MYVYSYNVMGFLISHIIIHKAYKYCDICDM